MATEINASVKQIGPTTSQGNARQHTVLIDRPEAKGGADQGAMGGEWFLVALGGCFMSNLLAAIRAREADVRNVNVSIMGTLEDNPSRFTDVELTITAEYDDADLMEKLVTISERGCIVANSIRNAVNLSFKISPAHQVQTA
jgi:putative redox protein